VGKADLFSVLRHRDDVTVSRAELAEDVDLMIDRVSALEDAGEIVLAPTVKGKRGDVVVDDALRAFAGYHTQEVLAPRGGELVLRDTRLLFYYQNRLAAHGLGFDAIAPKGVAPARRPKSVASVRDAASEGAAPHGRAAAVR